jgi:hypothetical protein
MRASMVTALLLAWLGSAAAQQASVERIEVLATGLYREILLGTQPSPGTALGHVRITQSQLTIPSDHVCAKLDTSFGFDFIVVGGPSGTQVELDLVTVFPPQGLLHPDGRRIQRSTFKGHAVLGQKQSRTYNFEEPWEMEPGEWVFEFHYQGRKIGEHRITVLATCPSV